jgi:hypothetical protein
MTTPTAPSGPRASFGERLIAAIIDSIVVGLATGLLGRIGFFGSVIGFIVSYGYYVYLEGSPSGQTVGKRRSSGSSARSSLRFPACSGSSGCCGIPNGRPGTTSLQTQSSFPLPPTRWPPGPDSPPSSFWR